MDPGYQDQQQALQTAYRKEQVIELVNGFDETDGSCKELMTNGFDLSLESSLPDSFEQECLDAHAFSTVYSSGEVIGCASKASATVPARIAKRRLPIKGGRRFQEITNMRAISIKQRGAITSSFCNTSPPKNERSWSSPSPSASSPSARPFIDLKRSSHVFESLEKLSRVSWQKTEVPLFPRVSIYSTFAQRARGLLGTQPRPELLMIAPCHSIHTFGMRYPIHIAFFDEMGM